MRQYSIWQSGINAACFWEPIGRLAYDRNERIGAIFRNLSGLPQLWRSESSAENRADSIASILYQLWGGSTIVEPPIIPSIKEYQ